MIKSRFIWASSLDRGIHIVLRNWDKIREIMPDATLKIFYGTDLWEKMSKNGYKPDLLAEIKELTKQDGVEYIGSVGQDRLAKEWIDAEYMIFPRDIGNCIFEAVLVEAMASGTIVIASDKGAVPEVLGDCGITIEGNPESDDWQKKMLDKLANLCYNINLKRKLIVKGKERVKMFSWDKVIDLWEGIIEEGRK